MLEESTTESIDIGIGIFNFSDFSKNSWNSIEALPSQITNVIVLDVTISEGFQVHKSRVGVSEDGVSVAGDHSA